MLIVFESSKPLYVSLKMTEKTNTPNSQADKRKKKKKSGYIFPIGITILSCICLPYYYYAVNINAYGQVNKPEGYHMP